MLFDRIINGVKSLLSAGGPSASRLLMLAIGVAGAWLLYYGAKSGEVSWAWAVCFIAYLAYGMGPHTLAKWFNAIQVIRGGANAEGSKAEGKATE